MTASSSVTYIQVVCFACIIVRATLMAFVRTDSPSLVRLASAAAASLSLEPAVESQSRLFRLGCVHFGWPRPHDGPCPSSRRRWHLCRLCHTRRKQGLVQVRPMLFAVALAIAEGSLANILTETPNWLASFTAKLESNRGTSNIARAPRSSHS